LITVTTGAAPEIYLSVIMSEQQVKGNGMTLNDLKIVMYQVWRQSKGSIDEHTTKTTLARFEGHCYQCKQKGHKADAWPNGNKMTDNNEDMNKVEQAFEETAEPVVS
jgi:hypothetical protein